MADSVRQQVIDAIITRIKTITTANGYETDVGNSVFEWHTTDFAEADLPVIDVRDTSESVEVIGGHHANTLNVEVEVKTLGIAGDTEIRDIIADISKAIGTDTSLGSLVQNTRPVNNEILSAGQQDKKIYSVIVGLEVQYRTKAFSPYTKA